MGLSPNSFLPMHAWPGLQVLLSSQSSCDCETHYSHTAEVMYKGKRDLPNIYALTLGPADQANPDCPCYN